MMASSEPTVSPEERRAPLGSRWREAAERQLQDALPTGSVTVSCSAPLGAGGLGRHLKEIVDALERREQPTSCICGSTSEPETGDRERRRSLTADPSALLARLPMPLSPGVRTRAFMAEFDAYAARHLPPAQDLIAFNGQARTQFRAARRARCNSVSLVSANSHLRRVVRRHARAHRQYPLEGSWASQLVRRAEREYAEADRIFVASDYTRESFLEEGFPDALLSRLQFTPDPRYRPDRSLRRPDTFNVVYVGSLTVAKGVPLLVDAMRRLPYGDLRLELVGGWATRGMRRFIQAACAEDPRISTAPGDPLPRLRAASLYVHPSYEDGFAYAPAEAMACGVPVLVSSDTGMKELIESPSDGLILPTGELHPLTEAIEAAYRREILSA
jgi:glycosyltransferase involved in cell wall biosynthesis